MNKTIITKSECIGRVVVFGGRTDLVFTPKETALFTNLTAIGASLDAAAAQQSGGNRGFREHVGERQVAAQAIRTALRDICEIAKSLTERGVDIGAKEAFRLPRRSSYENLAAAAQSFIDLVEPRKALFTERGLAATFVEDLEALKTSLISAGDSRSAESGRQVGGTAGMEIIANQGMEVVRELRSIMRVKLRTTPGLLEEWEALARVHKAPVNRSSTDTPPDPTSSLTTTGGGGSGTEAPPTVTV